ncbi:MAG: hypothetical protein V7739_18010 [Motiliproteus sp.]
MLRPILVVLSLSLSGISVAANTPSYPAAAEDSHSLQLSLPSCPHPIKMTLPENYSIALSADNTGRQGKLLRSLHRNKARKATYRHILMKEWGADFSFPYIAVGTLNAALEQQGSIDDDQWSAIKGKLLRLQSSTDTSSSISELIGAYQQQVNYRYNPNLNRIIDVIEHNPDSLTLLGKFSQDQGNGRLNVFTSSKIVRVGQCVAVVTLFFYSKDTQVAKRLEQLTGAISVTR